MKADRETEERLALLPEAAARELRDVVFTPEAGERVRQRLGQGADRKSRRRWLPAVIGGAAAAAVAAVVLLYPPSLSVKAENLMKGIQPAAAAGEPLSDDFKAAAADFSLRLAAAQGSEGNVLVSPLSLYLTLCMLSNGAAGQTQAELEALLGFPDTAARNAQCRTLLDRLTQKTEQGRVTFAHSIWFDETFPVSPAFLQTNADIFSADAYRGDFSSSDTVRDINRWGKFHTDGMIPHLIDSLQASDGSGSLSMALIGAVLFDQKWETPYKKAQILQGLPFYAPERETRADYLSSTENTFLQGEGFTGFIKAYQGGTYQFAALLPDEGSSPEKLLASLDGAAWLSALQNAGGLVEAYIPKFSTDVRLDLQAPLRAMGLLSAFDAGADFSRLTDSPNDVRISEAFLQARVELDENGTKAAAIHFFGLKDGGAAPPAQEVRLDRPFVYAIVHADTGLPLFIGVLRNPAV